MGFNIQAQLKRLSPRMPSEPGRVPKSESFSLTVVRSKALRGITSGNVAREQFGPATKFPFLGSATNKLGERTLLWVYNDEDPQTSPDTIGITRRGQSRLGTSVDQPISIEVPRHLSLGTATALAQDLPEGASIHVSPDVFSAFASRSRSRTYALLTTDQRMAAPVRLYKRPMSDSYARVAMFVRILSGISDGSTIQLSRFPSTPSSQFSAQLVARVFMRPPDARWQRRLAVILGLAVRGLRLMDLAIELVLRLVLRSQPLAFRVLQANPGDDDLRDTIRIHPTAFSALALSPGGQVILNWAGRTMTARVLEDPVPADTASPHILDSAGLHLDAPGYLPDGFPAHLAVRIPAPMRQSLNIPPSTIIEIRRRLRPTVISHLNQLTIPVAGIILAAAAIPAVRGWPLIAGSIAAIALGLAPLRMPRTPRGRWP
jgi:hypothetical protein